MEPIKYTSVLYLMLTRNITICPSNRYSDLSENGSCRKWPACIDPSTLKITGMRTDHLHSSSQIPLEAWRIRLYTVDINMKVIELVRSTQLVIIYFAWSQLQLLFSMSNQIINKSNSYDQSSESKRLNATSSDTSHLSLILSYYDIFVEIQSDEYASFLQNSYQSLFQQLVWIIWSSLSILLYNTNISNYEEMRWVWFGNL
jgi:hypothetical protein